MFDSMTTDLRIDRADPTKPMVALTFDDGPSEYTSLILDYLQVHGGRVSFFVMGSLVEKHKSKIQRATNMWCEVICHAWTHQDFTKLSKRKIKKQLIDTIAAIATVTGNVLPFFRPPFGYINGDVEKVSKKLGLAMVNWSVDPKDWYTRDTKAVYDAIMKEVKSGDIVLCHDVYDSTAEAMSLVIPELIAQGYQLVTVTELLLHRYGEIEPGRLYLC